MSFLWGGGFDIKGVLTVVVVVGDAGPRALGNCLGGRSTPRGVSSLPRVASSTFSHPPELILTGRCLHDDRKNFNLTVL